ncbi:hypothetical protein H696_02373 [Fonticula alba]|uniref:Ras-GAP domain-containing protein n=1 Tax=Fonticula alba TaxID=691883 RepID=A0A058ZAK1_FONAL|nr:hypothetical protein H696_02373 [Fonticula alba]KCV71425.1 hypothetical protein H696_02373 [Fonticula alba]|eukprot:XP_009494548.1 hypothetical protein H696_02373 [Fonticula alba]
MPDLSACEFPVAVTAIPIVVVDTPPPEPLEDRQKMPAAATDEQPDLMPPAVADAPPAAPVKSTASSQSDDLSVDDVSVHDNATTTPPEGLAQLLPVDDSVATASMPAEDDPTLFDTQSDASSPEVVAIACLEGAATEPNSPVSPPVAVEEDPAAAAAAATTEDATVPPEAEASIVAPETDAAAGQVADPPPEDAIVGSDIPPPTAEAALAQPEDAAAAESAAATSAIEVAAADAEKPLLSEGPPSAELEAAPADVPPAAPSTDGAWAEPPPLPAGMSRLPPPTGGDGDIELMPVPASSADSPSPRTILPSISSEIDPQAMGPLGLGHRRSVSHNSRRSSSYSPLNTAGSGGEGGPLSGHAASGSFSSSLSVQVALPTLPDGSPPISNSNKRALRGPPPSTPEEQLLLMKLELWDDVFTDDLDLLAHLCQQTYLNSQILTASIIVLLEHTNHADYFLKRLIRTRIFLNRPTESHDFTNIMRDNSLSVMLSSAFARHHGPAYLETVISPVIDKILEDTTIFEINPAEIKDPASVDLEANLHKFAGIVSWTISHILEKRDALPPKLRSLCTYMRRTSYARLKHYFPGDSDSMREQASLRLVGCFLFLRFIGPSIFAPTFNGLCYRTGLTRDERRALIMFTKALNILAAESLRVQKEEYMVPLGALLQKETAKMQSFLDFASSFDEDETVLVLSDPACGSSIGPSSPEKRTKKQATPEADGGVGAGADAAVDTDPALHEATSSFPPPAAGEGTSTGVAAAGVGSGVAHEGSPSSAEAAAASEAEDPEVLAVAAAAAGAAGAAVADDGIAHATGPADPPESPTVDEADEGQPSLLKMHRLLAAGQGGSLPSTPRSAITYCSEAPGLLEAPPPPDALIPDSFAGNLDTVVTFLRTIIPKFEISLREALPQLAQLPLESPALLERVKAHVSAIDQLARDTTAAATGPAGPGAAGPGSQLEESRSSRSLRGVEVDGGTVRSTRSSRRISLRMSFSLFTNPTTSPPGSTPPTPSAAGGASVSAGARASSASLPVVAPGVAGASHSRSLSSSSGGRPRSGSVSSVRSSSQGGTTEPVTPAPGSPPLPASGMASSSQSVHSSGSPDSAPKRERSVSFMDRLFALLTCSQGIST